MVQKDFQDAESVRSGQSHVTSQPVFFPPHPDLGGMLSRSLGLPSRNNGPPSIWDTHGIPRNVFANPTESSSAPGCAREPEEHKRHEEKNKKFFEENQTNSLLQTIFKMTQHGMMRKLKMISGPSHPESNCTCHFSSSTSPEQHICHWMCCWKKKLMITGTWMEKENYLMHGQASQDSFS